MEQFLKANPKIDVLFAHNDDMGLGALEAITAAGKVPGKDIKIITIDAVKDGMQALADGKFNFIAECSPLLGPQLMDLVKKVMAGETIPKRILTEETTFTPEQAKAALPDPEVLGPHRGSSWHTLGARTTPPPASVAKAWTAMMGPSRS